MVEVGVVTASRLHDLELGDRSATRDYREGSDFLVRVIGMRFAEEMLCASLMPMGANRVSKL